MDRSLELPEQTSCVGQRYNFDEYCGFVRQVVGECDEGGDMSDWTWWEYQEIQDEEGNLIMVMDENARFEMIKSGYGVINIYKDPKQ